MTKCSQFFLAIAVLMNFSAAHARVKKSNLKVRQTQKVSAVTADGSKTRAIQNCLKSANTLADSLDDKAGKIIDAMSQSAFKKWWNNIDEDQMKAQYAEELMVHMSRMTFLFKEHRKRGPFAKLNEFEFQNLLVKSDYLLSLAISRESLETARRNTTFAKTFETTLAAYNTERVGFDQKMIRFAFNER
ncbi:MAG TPA: hypothetical protein VF412_03780 [Bdellovibrio sp.]|uniref:hypothetical protein n=1 Tax=Bdellovibrio sp. TaxID=28201 RepID=UPI002EFA34A0